VSIDEKVTRSLMKTLEDGRHGFQRAAELIEQDFPEVASALRESSVRRLTMYAELQAFATTHGEALEDSGSVVASVHRGWLVLAEVLAEDSIKAIRNGDGLTAVLHAVMTGEIHTVRLFEKALKEELTEEFRTVVDRQLGELSESLVEANGLGGRV
jgi:uncharacterized protein (TIGR02284 family)